MRFASSLRNSPTPLLVALGLALPFTAALTGCRVSRTIPAASIAAVYITGHARGGQQPVAGASIQLYSAGKSGNFSASTAMLTTPLLTDASGSFNITGDYTCANPQDQTYLVATGGNPGFSGNVNNAALTLVTALGSCSGLATIANVSINELTTVAAAYALAPFALDATHIGASVTNASGLADAMTTTAMLADPQSGLAPGSALPVNALAETAKLITLADILAQCVNSDGSGFCPTLFTHATVPGRSTPADTFASALNIAAKPGIHVAAIYSDLPAVIAFGGALAQAPSDWSMSIAYTGGGLSSPTSVDIDANHNIWVASAGGAISSFSSQGVPNLANGITGAGLNQTVGLTIDAASNVWVTNLASAANVNNAAGTVTQVDNSGNVLSGANGYTAGAINYPVAIAADPNGNVWVANRGGGTVSLFDYSGAPLSGANGFGAAQLSAPTALAVDGAHNIWIVDPGFSAVTQLNATGHMNFTTYASPHSNSIALDSSGNAWVGDNSAGSIAHLAANGVSITQNITGGGLNSPRTLAEDAGNQLWITNSTGNSISEFASNEAALSPTSGYGLDAGLQQPFGLKADSAGNLWVSSLGDNRLIKFVGIAIPTANPLLGLPAQP